MSVVGDWVAITARIVELHPNGVDYGVELFSKTDQWKAFVRSDLCTPIARPLPPEPDEGSVALVLDRAYQRFGSVWVGVDSTTRLRWASLNDLGDVAVVHHA